jgi:hypothetical protein
MTFQHSVTAKLQITVVPVAGPLYLPFLQWTSKLPPILAFDGGIGRIVKQYLINTGKYEEFYRIVEQHRQAIFGDAPFSDVEHGVFLPNRTLDEDGNRFSSCSKENFTRTRLPKCSASHAKDSGGKAYSFG